MLENLFLNSSADRTPLRIGVMIDEEHLIKPFAEVLDHIASSDFAQLALVIRNAHGPNATGRRSRLGHLLRMGSDAGLRGRVAFARYIDWDRRRHIADCDTLTEVDCSGRFAGLPRLDVTPLSKGFVDRFPPEAIARIREHDLDVILRFGFRILRGEVLETARYGIWSYHHGDGDRYRGAPPSFWEVAEREPLSGAMLQVLTEKLDDGIVLAKALAPTWLGISTARNSLAPYSAAEPLVIWKLHQLHEKGWESVLAAAPAKQPYRGRRKIYTTPSVARLSAFLARELTDSALRKAGLKPRIADGYWRMAIRKASEAETSPWQGDWSDFRWCEPANAFLADPVLFEDGGRTWMFFEQFDYARDKAHISCAEVLADGCLSPFEPVLVRPYHLSMPLVFRHEGEAYMIPEAASSGNIELYKAEEFPRRWRLERTLLEMPGLDTIPHFAEDGSIYFFTSVRHKPSAHPTLLLFRAQDLHEPWQLHPASPLSMDARYSRNAGAILRIGGHAYRPSQDLTLFYGRQMHFHRIVRLNPNEYVEEIAGQRGPSPAWSRSIGTHTYSRAGGWEAIDGYFLGRPAKMT